MKYYLLLFAVWLSLLSSYAQDSRTYTLEHHLSDFELKTNKDGLSTIYSNKQKMHAKFNENLPNLPYYIVHILLPDQTGIDYIEVKKVDSLLAEGIVIEPAHAVVSGSIPSDSVPIYQYDKGKVYNSYASCLEVQQFRRYRMVNIFVSPFTFEGVNNKLSLSTKMTITLHYKKETISEQPHVLTLNECESFCRENALNYSELDSFYPKIPEIKGSVNKPSNPDFYQTDYLIITSNALKDAFERFAEFKHQKGLRTKIVTTEEIEQMTSIFKPEDITLVAKIKRYLNQFIPIPDETTHPSIFRWEQSLKYILLGGDDVVVPTYIYDPRRVYIPTDHYYVCQGSNNYEWKNGSIDLDLTPSFYIGRLPLRTRKEVDGYIDKLIQYETKGCRYDDWKSNYFSMVGASTLVRNDAKIKCENLFKEINKTYIEAIKGRVIYNILPKDHNDIGVVYKPITTTQMYAILRGKEQHLIVHAHGQYDRWLNDDFSGLDDVCYTPFYTVDNAKKVVAPYPKIVSSTSCRVSDFTIEDDSYQEYPCLGEAFMRNAKSGVIAFMGNTSDSYEDADFDTTTVGGKAQKIIQLFYEELLNPKVYGSQEIGKALMFAKERFYAYEKGYVPIYMYLTYSLFGDPQIPVYTVKPSLLTEGFAYSHYCDEMDFGYDLAKEFNISITGTGYRNFIKNSNGIYRLNVHSIPADSFVVCLTAKNHLTYRINVFKQVDIKGLTLSSDSQYKGNFIDIGLDPYATTSYEQGKVLIIGGTHTFKTPGSMTIGKGVKIKKGADIRLKIFKNVPY